MIPEEQADPISGDVACAVVLATPLGPLEVSVGHRGAVRRPPAEPTSTPAGGLLSRWPAEDGPAVEVLVTPYDGLEGMPQYRVTASWGVVVTVACPRATAPIEVVASLPEGLQGSPDDGQYLAACLYETPDWVLTVGGPGDDLLEAWVDEHTFPEQWRGAFSDVEVTGSGVFARTTHELGWLLPALPAGATVALHVAVAWSRPGEDAGIANWFAVDTSPHALIAASRQRR
ncbi:hypothetical protein [Blastococcus sp. SYSU D00820]